MTIVLLPFSDDIYCNRGLTFFFKRIQTIVAALHYASLRVAPVEILEILICETILNGARKSSFYFSRGIPAVANEDVVYAQVVTDL